MTDLLGTYKTITGEDWVMAEEGSKAPTLTPDQIEARRSTEATVICALVFFLVMIGSSF